MKQFRNSNYFVDEFGKVFTKIYDRELKGEISIQGYRRVRLGPLGKFAVHRLVAELYCENPHNFPQVNHIDGDKLNNHFINLEWCTAKHNIIHSHKNKLVNLCNGTKSNLAKLIDSQVLEIRSLHEQGKSKSDLAKMFNIGVSNIYAIVTRRSWKHI